MNVVFLGLGGNIGDRLANIHKAVKALGLECGIILKASPVYETEAWGTVSEKKYLNQVVKIKTSLSALQLQKKTLAIEKKLGRKRTGERYSDRVVDIDILFFNHDIISLEQLQVPHPRLHLRRFVLIPLREIEPRLMHPILKKSISELLESCPDKLEVKMFQHNEPLRYICIEGNIGSGKSTLAKALVKKFNAVPLPEQFEENQLLPLFYSNPAAYAFSLEFGFLIRRFEQLSAVFKAHPALVISDYSFYKCLVFARINLPRKEYLLFKRQFVAFAGQLPEPDLIIYLRSSPGNLQKNIKKRGRPYEQGISSDYLKLVGEGYEKWLKSVKRPKVLAIPIKKYHPKLESESIRVIENYVKENFGQAI
jgi:deoxyguanosine kinase